MSAMISCVGRASTLAVASGGRGRGRVVAVSLTASLGAGFEGAVMAAMASLNMGAAGGPAGSSTPFTTTATVASAATKQATASRRLQPKRASAAKRGVSAALSLLRLDLGTDLHQLVSGTLGCGLDDGRGRTRRPLSDGRHLGRPARAFAIHRQADRDARALPDPARDLHFTSVQRHQSLNDREPQSGSIMTAVIGRACLEERIANVGHVLAVDPDTRVRDRHREGAALVPGANRDPATAIGKLDGIGNKIEHDLIERTLVGDNVRQLARQDCCEFNPRFARFEGKQPATIFD